MSVINDLQSFYKNIKAESVDLVANTNLIWLSPDVIEEEDGFNLRDYDQPDTIEHIEKLAAAWQAGDQMPPLEVSVRNGRCFVRDGHCRLRAARLAISRGAGIRRVSVIELKGNDDQANVRLLTSNNSLKLTNIQRAKGYQRLRNFGWSDQEIANSVGTTATTIRESAKLLTLPAALQRFIEDRVVAPHLVLKLYRDKGEEAITIIQEAFDRQWAEIASMNGTGKDQEGETENSATSTEEQELKTTAPAVKPQIRVQAKNLSDRARPLSKFFTREIGSAVTELRTVMEKAVPNAESGTINLAIPVELFESLMKLSSSVYREVGGLNEQPKDPNQLEIETQQTPD